MGFGLMIFLALIDIRWLMRYAYLFYAGTLVLLIAVDITGHIGMGAQRWINFGFFKLQPSELMKIALVMVLFGIMAIAVLPVSQYPHITPPQIVVKAVYPGANAKVLQDMVAIPIENAVNGVDDMLYMSSTSDDNGIYTLTITFNIGVDPDMAQVKVQNRLQEVNSILPEVVNKQGLSVKTQSANILGMLVLRSPNNTYDNLYR